MDVPVPVHVRRLGSGVDDDHGSVGLDNECGRASHLWIVVPLLSERNWTSGLGRCEKIGNLGRPKRGRARFKYGYEDGLYWSDS